MKKRVYLMAKAPINIYADAVRVEENPPPKETARLSTGEALIFSAKAAVSAVMSLLCLAPFHEHGKVWTIWAPVSAVIVTQAKLHPSLQASLLRVKANLIGAVIGAIAGMLTDHAVVALLAGVFAAGIVCHLARLEEAARPAYAAVVIVTLMNHDSHGWFGSLDRILGVVLGCAVALVVGLAFDLASRLFISNAKENAETRGRPE